MKPSDHRAVSLLVVCTGNVARSVMAATMLGVRARSRGLALEVASAGTHALDGQPVGARTLGALTGLEALEGAAASGITAHRSRHLEPGHLVGVDLVVAMEADHVRYVRRRHPHAAPITGTIRHLAHTLSPGPGPIVTRVEALGLADAPLGAPDDEDVADPAGGDEAAYAACAGELWELCGALVERL